jgi:hypothetical protein
MTPTSSITSHIYDITQALLNPILAGGASTARPVRTDVLLGPGAHGDAGDDPAGATTRRQPDWQTASTARSSSTALTVADGAACRNTACRWSIAITPSAPTVTLAADRGASVPDLHLLGTADRRSPGTADHSRAAFAPLRPRPPPVRSRAHQRNCVPLRRHAPRGRHRRSLAATPPPPGHRRPRPDSRRCRQRRSRGDRTVRPARPVDLLHRHGDGCRPVARHVHRAGTCHHLHPSGLVNDVTYRSP